jgi:hypothetical protein
LGRTLKAIFFFYPANTNAEAAIPDLGFLLHFAMLSIFFPRLNGLKAGPIRNGDSDFLTDRLEAEKPGLA